jgi:hypothetical protein
MSEQELFGAIGLVVILIMLYSIPYISSYVDNYKKDKQAH